MITLLDVDLSKRNKYLELFPFSTTMS